MATRATDATKVKRALGPEKTTEPLGIRRYCSLSVTCVAFTPRNHKTDKTNPLWSPAMVIDTPRSPIVAGTRACCEKSWSGAHLMVAGEGMETLSFAKGIETLIFAKGIDTLSYAEGIDTLSFANGKRWLRAPRMGLAVSKACKQNTPFSAVGENRAKRVGSDVTYQQWVLPVKFVSPKKHPVQFAGNKKKRPCNLQKTKRPRLNVLFIFMCRARRSRLTFVQSLTEIPILNMAYESTNTSGRCLRACARRSAAL